MTSAELKEFMNQSTNLYGSFDLNGELVACVEKEEGDLLQQEDGVEYFYTVYPASGDVICLFSDGDMEEYIKNKEAHNWRFTKAEN